LIHGKGVVRTLAQRNPTDYDGGQVREAKDAVHCMMQAVQHTTYKMQHNHMYIIRWYQVREAKDAEHNQRWERSEFPSVNDLSAGR
jgi:hypothetical protein